MIVNAVLASEWYPLPLIADLCSGLFWSEIQYLLITYTEQVQRRDDHLKSYMVKRNKLTVQSGCILEGRQAIIFPPLRITAHRTLQNSEDKGDCLHLLLVARVRCSN